MLNKKIWLRSILFISCLAWLSLSFVSAVSLKIDLDSKPIQAISEDAIFKNIMPVYFADNENDFGWFLYLSNGSGAGTYTLEVLWTDSIFECSSQVKWFYYNAERGERLWPLDAQTFSGINDALETTWWIYTMCVNTWYNQELKECENNNNYNNYNYCVDIVRKKYESDGFGYYGSLTHKYYWQEYNLTVWVKYKKDNNDDPFYKMDRKSGFAPTFVRLENKYPIWFIYDYNGWVGLAWCKCDSWKMAEILEHGSGDITEVFMYSGWIEKIVDKKNLKIVCDEEKISVEDMVKIIIEWVVWLDDRSGPKFWGLGNSSDTKMQYFGTKSVSNVALMNYATKKAESLCRWKWWGVSDNQSKKEIYCIQANNGTIDANNYLTDSTLIVKGGNVKVSPNKRNINVFIDSWNLIIEEGNDTTGYVFTTGGVVLEDSSLVNEFSGAVKASGSDYKWTYAGVASLIKWNFIVNWNVVWSGNGNDTLKNKYFIYGKFMTKDSLNELEDKFVWRCNNWIGTDGNFCPKFEWNPYWNAALVVIDKNDGNFPLFES